MKIEPGPRRGNLILPRSKSHEHRLLIADFLAGDCSRLADAPHDSADILATKRCLRALASDDSAPVLDCGESGSTRRFLGPVAAALGKHPLFKMSSRLAARPQIEYARLQPGRFELAGDVSSQFVTGLLFALPILDGDSSIHLSKPLQSRGYVDMTLRVLRDAGLRIDEGAEGFTVPGRQRYRAQPQTKVEGDWSSGAFWLAMNALGSEISIEGLSADSCQPDRMVPACLTRITAASPRDEIEIDVSNAPDLFPVLSVVAGAAAGVTTFTGTRRERLKESDRVAAMQDVLTRLGVSVSIGDDFFRVFGHPAPFKGGDFQTFGDHRVAMSIAVAATHAASFIELDNAACVAKSYPAFFSDFNSTLAASCARKPAAKTVRLVGRRRCKVVPEFMV